MAEPIDFTPPVMRSRAGLRDNSAPELLCQECQYLAQRTFLAGSNRPVVLRPVNLENPLCQADTDDSNFGMDAPSFCDAVNSHHIGALRCRQEEPSTSSTEPLKLQKPVRRPLGSKAVATECLRQLWATRDALM